MISQPTEVLDRIIFLYKNYSIEYRANTQPFHLDIVKKIIKNYSYKYDDLLVREPLIEHSGSLPIVATTIFPHINNHNVKLGDALIMLAIHDIGEIETHDEITFTKRVDNSIEERAARNLLPRILYPYYLEIENRSTDTGKFAKSIDKMTPDIIDLMTPPEITVERYRNFVKIEASEIVEKIKKFKHPYMEWNEFIKNLHLEILRRLNNKLKKYY